MTYAAERNVQESSATLIRFEDYSTSKHGHPLRADSQSQTSKMEQWSVNHRGRNYRLTVTTWEGGARQYDLRTYCPDLCVYCNVPAEEELIQVLKVFRSLTD